jgi:hypothetical protein
VALVAVLWLGASCGRDVTLGDPDMTTSGGGAPPTRATVAPTTVAALAAAPQGFVAREAARPFEPRALPAGFEIDVSTRPPAIAGAGDAGTPAPNLGSVTSYVFRRQAPFAQLTIIVFPATPLANVPNTDNVTGLRPVDVAVSREGASPTARWVEGSLSVFVVGTGMTRTELFDVIRLLRGP